MRVDSLAEELSDLEHEFTGGVGRGAIEAASMQLGIHIPPCYAEFLERFGSGYISYHEIIGLGGPAHLNLLQVVNQLRQRSGGTALPHHLLPILADGYGNYECLDTRRDAHGGAPVVQWLHDGGASQDCPVIAKSFEDWLDGVVAQIKSVEAGDKV